MISNIKTLNINDYTRINDVRLYKTKVSSYIIDLYGDRNVFLEFATNIVNDFSCF